ncbi:hypothetical protein PsorP6_002854 [Peronosclerospora sorghi]|uniref:Uncharacterized protein n=1 Tax=Peronosclerospora sorghi TaxID=230839 RepID=A0ACC0VM98_9STRA|nr:hypothetical protein PsorP6_002854 [Peronosclerospora sorghi]
MCSKEDEVVEPPTVSRDGLSPKHRALLAAERAKNFTPEQQKHYAKKKARREETNIYRQNPAVIRQWVREMSDSLVIAAIYYPEEVLMALMSFLSRSKPFVVYSEFLEPLTRSFAKLQKMKANNDLQLSETWTRIAERGKGLGTIICHTRDSSQLLISCVALTLVRCNLFFKAFFWLNVTLLCPIDKRTLASIHFLPFNQIRMLELKKARREETNIYRQKPAVSRRWVREMSDSLLIADNYYPEEPLTQSFAKLQKMKAINDLQLSETWTRETQVLPGMTHPEMNMSAFSGVARSIGMKDTDPVDRVDSNGSCELKKPKVATD